MPARGSSRSARSPPGDELTYDYSCHLLSSDEQLACACETPSCRGVIGPFERCRRRCSGTICSSASYPRRQHDSAPDHPAARPAASAAARTCTCADRRPAGRDAGRVDLGGEGRPVRGRQRQLPGQPPGRATGLGLSRSRRHRRHQRVGPGTRPRAGPAGGGDGVAAAGDGGTRGGRRRGALPWRCPEGRWRC